MAVIVDDYRLARIASRLSQKYGIIRRGDEESYAMELFSMD